MINLKKASLLAAVGVMLAPAAVLAADYTHDVVKDGRGNIVLSGDGNCVQTKWEADVDECGPGMVGRHAFTKLSREQRTVYFDFNKSTLNAHEKAKLTEVSRIIRHSKEVESVDIVGHADQMGKSSYNKRLSLRRAQTVRSYLASKGLKTRHVRVEGVGETSPIAHCNDKMSRKERIACLAPNRRVEIEVNVKP